MKKAMFLVAAICCSCVDGPASDAPIERAIGSAGSMSDITVACGTPPGVPRYSVTYDVPHGTATEPRADFDAIASALHASKEWAACVALVVGP